MNRQVQFGNLCNHVSGQSVKPFFASDYLALVAPDGMHGSVQRAGRFKRGRVAQHNGNRIANVKQFRAVIV